MGQRRGRPFKEVLFTKPVFHSECPLLPRLISGKSAGQRKRMQAVTEMHVPVVYQHSYIRTHHVLVHIIYIYIFIYLHISMNSDV